MTGTIHGSDITGTTIIVAGTEDGILIGDITMFPVIVRDTDLEISANLAKTDTMVLAMRPRPETTELSQTTGTPQAATTESPQTEEVQEPTGDHHHRQELYRVEAAVHRAEAL